MIHKVRLMIIATAFCLWGVATVARAAILEELSCGKSLIISAIGTSETAASPWFSPMGDWLKGLYPGKVTLDNEAISGTSSVSGISVQLPIALEHAPDAVFIEFAINDATPDANLTVEQSKANLQAMINRINNWAAVEEKSVDIIIQTTNNDPYTPYRPDLASYYQGYREVAAANGLLLIDHYPTWQSLYATNKATWDTYVPDGIHPGTLGVQNVILPEIQTALNSQTPEPNAAVLAITGLLGLIGCTWKKIDQPTIRWKKNTFCNTLGGKYDLQ